MTDNTGALRRVPGDRAAIDGGAIWLYKYAAMELAHAAPAAIALLGLALGMRHATDADHVIAVSTIVTRERRLGIAARIGFCWGLGHTLTIMLVGIAIIVFKVAIPARVGLAMEFAVALVLILLGVPAVASLLRRAAARVLGRGARASAPKLIAHSHPHVHGAALAHRHPHVHVMGELDCADSAHSFPQESLLPLPSGDRGQTPLSSLPLSKGRVRERSRACEAVAQNASATSEPGDPSRRSRRSRRPLLGQGEVMGVEHAEHGHHLLPPDALPATARLGTRFPQAKAFGVGLVHGLAGSAAIALLVLSAIPNPLWAMLYLMVFGLGTVAGMILITTALGVPLIVATERAAGFNRALALGSGLLSFGFGAFLAWQIGFVDGLLRGAPIWIPH